MYFRPAILVPFVALLLASGTGCQKSGSVSPVAPATTLSPETVASVHWLGKKRLGITAGAYYFARIWQQPQSAQLERQTLIKLATAPGQWLPGGTNLTADACSRLWWLLNDIVQEESYLEIRQPANGSGETVFAIRLNQAQREQWRTNLPVVLEPLTGPRTVVSPEQDGWSLKTADALNLIELTRVGDWTLVGASAGENLLLADLAARIRRDGAPFVSSGTNLWLEAGLDLPRLAAVFPALNFQPLGAAKQNEGGSTFNRLDLSVSGDGGNVITRARLVLSKPFSSSLEPWRLPLDLVHEPLTSLTAARGLQPWLADWFVWRDLQIGMPPDQFCLWSLAGGSYQIYLAAPLPASGVSALTDRLLQNGNPWLATNGYISFDRAPDGNGVTWGNLPDIKPFIKFAGTDSQGWLFAGLLPDTNSAALPPPAGLVQDILRRTNLVYYDWEVTGPRLQPCLQLAQTARLVTRQPQLPMDSVSLNWLAMLISRLGTSATIINRTGPAELTLYRRSTIGFTAPELHLLAGWLESPQFPR